MAFLQVNNIVKNFGSTKVLKDISFSIPRDMFDHIHRK